MRLSTDRRDLTSHHLCRGIHYFTNTLSILAKRARRGPPVPSLSYATHQHAHVFPAKTTCLTVSYPGSPCPPLAHSLGMPLRGFRHHLRRRCKKQREDEASRTRLTGSNFSSNGRKNPETGSRGEGHSGFVDGKAQQQEFLIFFFRFIVVKSTYRTQPQVPYSCLEATPPFPLSPQLTQDPTAHHIIRD